MGRDRIHAGNGAAGFTLTELAIVLVIVMLLTSGLLMSVSGQKDLGDAAETRKTLETVREALLGFAVANGRLPCPASGTSGKEAPETGGGCAAGYHNGYVPGIALGITPTDANGFVADAWGRPFRYAVSLQTINGQTFPFTTSNGMRYATIGKIAAASPLLSVCATSAGLAANACGSAQVLSSNAIAVVFSTGKNGGAAHGADEAANMDNDRAFVHHAQTVHDASGGEFDDLVTWLSPNVLFNRMIAAGQLP